MVKNLDVNQNKLLEHLQKSIAPKKFFWGWRLGVVLDIK